MQGNTGTGTTEKTHLYTYRSKGCLLGCNRDYLEFLSSLDNHSDGQRALQKFTEPKTDNLTKPGRVATAACVHATVFINILPTLAAA